MSQVFLDTVGLLALWDTSDQWHADAEAAYKLMDDEVEFVTTSFVLAECGNAAARRPYRNDVAELRIELEQAGLLIWPTEEDWQVAWEEYSRGQAGGAGIVDHLSFAVMRREDLEKAFTNDRHFMAAGFETLFRVNPRLPRARRLPAGTNA